MPCKAKALIHTHTHAVGRSVTHLQIKILGKTFLLFEFYTQFEQDINELWCHICAPKMNSIIVRGKLVSLIVHIVLDTPLTQSKPFS